MYTATYDWTQLEEPQNKSVGQNSNYSQNTKEYANKRVPPVGYISKVSLINIIIIFIFNILRWFVGKPIRFKFVGLSDVYIDMKFKKYKKDGYTISQFCYLRPM